MNVYDDKFYSWSEGHDRVNICRRMVGGSLDQLKIQCYSTKDQAKHFQREFYDVRYFEMIKSIIDPYLTNLDFSESKNSVLRIFNEIEIRERYYQGILKGDDVL